MIEFQQTAYDVTEGDGSVSVCLEIDPASSEPVTVSVSVEFGSAAEGMLHVFSVSTFT